MEQCLRLNWWDEAYNCLWALVKRRLAPSAVKGRLGAADILSKGALCKSVDDLDKKMRELGPIVAREELDLQSDPEFCLSEQPGYLWAVQNILRWRVF